MQDKIPLPTDNIYKFYALFGLIIIIFSIGSVIYINESTNNVLFNAIIDIETLNSIKNPSTIDTAKKGVLEKKVQIATADKKFFIPNISAISFLGLILVFYGFKKWHMEIQPIQDEIAKLTLEKIRHDIEIIQAFNHKNSG